ncbi:hypothetical protein FOXG_06444 [Fusarium oxysporum f. sp. lycopersici 4287]|uniref:WW domain-containing protein n=1 Tax=Fusarium oxysporum f. sp. lycopersici (strain 4287 / CBS 123668 / FGSC 9935 / NRRL 34936) TaxID=426428 RepID=A0A0J9V093_FUSO4|nr:hypothetical protein FOXG_06444 [Fusarium oxysporum f. sp. lycopersici 4287]KNB04266.1 hypothetical protein FOXG_06444 [Fusarium oxysporum f. sp. lycopersici 4287]
MLKSTHTPSAAALAPLPPGWSEHTAPTGHTYYYNAETKESTYKRPGVQPPLQPAQPQAPAYPGYGSIPYLADPNVANAYMAQFNQDNNGQRHNYSSRVPQKNDAPVAGLDDDSEYEEVEVTDDEGEGEGDEEHPSKRQRTADPDADEDVPMEFTEADFAAQLQAMGDDYGLEPGDYDDGNAEEWPEGAEGVPLSEDDAKYLFKDLLNDFNINPYSPWEKLLEEGKIIDDLRYTALSTTKARRDCWDEWTREKIAELKEQRARQEKRDPRIAYMAFLQEKATPKLYWPEFKRKYKKEDVMKDHKITDKDREKAYREHIGRLKMPQSKLKSDLTALLKAQPVHLLNNKSLSTGLPDPVLTDIRFISLEPKIRDPLIEAYVSNLPPPPEDLDAAKDDEEQRKQRESREKREKALEERNRVVEEQKKKRDREVAASKARLRDEERELEMAMKVGKQGLQSQLASMKVAEKEP